MKALHVVLTCLIILAIFNSTSATLRPLIQQENNFIPSGKNASHNSRKVSPIKRPGSIVLGDPVGDPKPR